MNLPMRATRVDCDERTINSRPQFSHLLLRGAQDYIEPSGVVSCTRCRMISMASAAGTFHQGPPQLNHPFIQGINFRACHHICKTVQSCFVVYGTLQIVDQCKNAETPTFPYVSTVCTPPVGISAISAFSPLRLLRSYRNQTDGIKSYPANSPENIS
jgi:hypothetical protein